MDPDLGRQLGVGGERGHRPLGQVQALVERRHRGHHVAPPTGSGSAGVIGRSRPSRGESVARATTGARMCAVAPDRRRAEPRQPQAGARRDRPVRRARRDREGPAPRRRLPSASPATSVATPTSGRRSCASSAPTVPPTGRAAARGSGSSSSPRACSGPRAVADLVMALEGDEEELYEAPGRCARGRGDRRRRARARRHLGAPEGRRADRRRSAAGGATAVADRAPAHRAPPTIGRREALAPGGRPVGDPARGHLRRQRRPGQQPRAGHGRRRRRVEQPELHPAGRASPACSPGAFSMAAGEYISMQSQRELFERQIALERAEIEAMPEEEAGRARRSLPRQGLHRGRGGAHRRSASSRTRTTALDMLVREELGLDPDELGSPWGAAFGSFVAFAVGRGHPGPAVPRSGRQRRRPASASA